jgi:hypothetical protein
VPKLEAATPFLNGFAFGEGSGVAFASGNSLSSSPGVAAGSATSKNTGEGGGFGGDVGYVAAFDVGSAYGGGRGGGNVSSLESQYGINQGSYTKEFDRSLLSDNLSGRSRESLVAVLRLSLLSYST